MASQSKYPEPCVRYVKRAMAEDNDVEGIGRPAIMDRLRLIIEGIQERGELYKTDWDKLPLPQHVLKAERDILRKNPTSNHIQATTPIWPDRMAGLRVSESASHTNSPPSSKKRKSSPEEESLENPQTSGKKGALRDRISHPDQNHSKRQDRKQRKEEAKFREQTGDISVSSKFDSRLEERKTRFERENNYVAPLRSPSPVDTKGPIIGTCQALEKPYFRLTTTPNPKNVRPVSILKQTLELLKAKWKEEHDYGYICNQFKSLRQDLTVQHIKDEFTVRVYENHARIALEKGDVGEYNQCQTQLRALYKQNIGGNPTEFLAYRILYFIYTRNGTDMNRALADVSLADRSDPAVQHALQTRSALALGNYHRFFRLYSVTPNLGAFLMDMFVQRERVAALAQICQS